MKTPANKGGTLRQQLDALIARTPPKPEPRRRVSRRLECAIEAVRRYICSECGVMGCDVTDKDVAKLALKLEWSWLYRNNFYVGFTTLEELQTWATDTLAGI